MDTCGVQITHQFVYQTKLHKFSNMKTSIVQLRFDGGRKWNPFRIKIPSFSSHNPISEADKLPVRAAASVPLSGDYADKLIGEKVDDKNQEEVDDPALLADSDACFCEFNGVQVHHKICEGDISNSNALEGSSLQSYNFPMVLLHGFGASVFSWDRVMKPLAQIVGSKVLAFDRPAFGLTSKALNYSSIGNKGKQPLNPYSMVFSALATLHFIDLLHAEKAILVGHSAGALVAVDAYFEAPERVAALILVAPAIIAPFSAPKQNQSSSDNQTQGSNSNANMGGNPIFQFLSKFTTYIAESVGHMLKGMKDMISSIYKQVLAAILRSALGVMVIRTIISKFGTSGVRSAWYDSNQVSDHILQGYTKPMRVKGWEKALAEYAVAMLTESPKITLPLAKRLADISCPVLIVTGDTDRIVPSWNSEKLSRAIPGSYFELIKNCGHLPQEEKHQEFISIVDKFLQTVFGSADEPILQVVA